MLQHVSVLFNVLQQLLPVDSTSKALESHPRDNSKPAENTKPTPSPRRCRSPCTRTPSTSGRLPSGPLRRTTSRSRTTSATSLTTPCRCTHPTHIHRRHVQSAAPPRVPTLPRRRAALCYPINPSHSCAAPPALREPNLRRLADLICHADLTQPHARR